MTTQQTLWPCFVPFEVSCSRQPHTAFFSGHADVAPHFYHQPTPRESRKFFLERSVYDFVNSHPYLALTDARLLGWYVRLPLEDKWIIQENGGFHQFLRDHPALELSNHHVFAKYPTINSSPAQPYIASSTSLDFVMLHNNMRETLNLRSCSNTDGQQRSPRVEIEQPDAQQLNHQIPEQPFRAEAHLFQPHQSEESVPCLSAAVWEDGASLASLSVDTLWNQSAVTQDQENSVKYAEVGPSQSGWPTVEPAGTPDEACVNLKDQRDTFFSIMEDDTGILACRPGDVELQSSGVDSGPVAANGKAQAASSVTSPSEQSVIKMSTANKSDLPVPHTPTCHAMVGTEPPACASALTQTEDPGTCDEHVNTEVHMADLDYLTEKFMALKMANKRLSEQKKKSVGCKLRKECECFQRAQKAELSLLALQYSMCSLYCWRLYYTSEEGQLTSLLKDPPANVASVLQKLEVDYYGMREKILAGVPLEQLRPLSADCEKIVTGSCYIPAQIVGDVLQNVPSWSFQELRDASGQENGSPDDQSRSSGQECLQPEPSQMKEQYKKNSKVRRRAVTFVPQHREAFHNAKKKEGNKTSAACKEVNTSEAWYDAEEDLEPEGPAESGPGPAGITEDLTREPGREEPSAVLCVPNLPSNVTELMTEVICISPTPKGTCVPQHYGTMGSFDTLMAELTQRHPDIKRQRIANALVELQAQHQGVLGSLPIRSIREMASELLTRAVTPLQNRSHQF